MWKQILVLFGIASTLNSAQEITSLKELLPYIAESGGIVLDVDGVLLSLEPSSWMELHEPPVIQQVFETAYQHGKPVFFCSATFHPMGYAKIKYVYTLLQRLLPPERFPWVYTLEDIRDQCSADAERALESHETSSVRFSLLQPGVKRYKVFRPTEQIVSAYQADWPAPTVLGTAQALLKDLAVQALLDEGYRNLLFVDDTKQWCDKVEQAVPDAKNLRVFHMKTNSLKAEAKSSTDHEAYKRKERTHGERPAAIVRSLI